MFSVKSLSLNANVTKSPVSPTYILYLFISIEIFGHGPQPAYAQPMGHTSIQHPISQIFPQICLVRQPGGSSSQIVVK